MPPNQSQHHSQPIQTREEPHISFAANCVSDGLEEQSQFQTSPKVEEVNGTTNGAPSNSFPSNDAQSNSGGSMVRGRSQHRCKAGTSSINRFILSENVEGFMSLGDVIPSEVLDVVLSLSSIVTRMHAMYVNKWAL
ncbi:hypothetical protein PanWU01x14_155760 [Parasponia andersonii]|uniref:Uncharacterized protein n=1 Tax=Parasponia andersonii TaxID=3476 RepID=A0A2P5CG89_PARAD|nr:hypothetical protein PanWU01x14_155760 [Parasponia andersonii]